MSSGRELNVSDKNRTKYNNMSFAEVLTVRDAEVAKYEACSANFSAAMDAIRAECGSDLFSAVLGPQYRERINQARKPFVTARNNIKRIQTYLFYRNGAKWDGILSAA